MEPELNEQVFHTEDNSNINEKTLLAARNAYKRESFQEALNLYLGIIHKTRDANIYIETGNCYYKLNKNQEALEHWEKATKLDRKNAKAYTNIGNLHYRNGNIEKAISFWLVAAMIKPEDAQTCLNIAVAFDKKGMRFESIKFFEKYIKYEEKKSSAEYNKIKTNLKTCFDTASKYLSLGVELQSQGENQNAASCYFQAFSNYPNLSKVSLNLGSLFFGDKNYELAIKYWLKSSHIDPKYEKIYSNLAIAYDMIEKFDYAFYYYYVYMNYVFSNKEEYSKVNKRVTYLKNYLQKHPEMFDKHLVLAQRHVANSEIYEAIDEYKIYVTLRPELKSDYRDVIRKLEAFINPEKQIIEDCFEQGNNYLEKGMFQEARACFSRIMRLAVPNSLEYTKARAKYTKSSREETGDYD